MDTYYDEDLQIDKYLSNFQKEAMALAEGLSPWPTSFDIDPSQGSRFSEFSYTDCLRGVYLNTQSIEINCRIMERASKEHCDDYTLMNTLSELIGDKYVLEEIDVEMEGYKLGFMVGQNMFDIVSNEAVARLSHENDDFFMKLHPLTSPESARCVAFQVGRNRIISNDISAYALIHNASEVYTSTASELTMAAVLLGKPVHNMSNFFNEAGGVYYPISRLLYNSDNPRQVLNNILNCEYSGLLPPSISNPEERIKAYYKHALEMREVYGSISSENHLKKEPINEGD